MVKIQLMVLYFQRRSHAPSRLYLQGKRKSDEYEDALKVNMYDILDSSKLNQFADDNFECDENGRMLSKWVVNIEEKGEIARFEQFLLFPQCFQKTCTAAT